MKQFLKKRWHSIPVALVSAVLVIALVAGGAFAAYNFLKADLQVQVEEAIAVGTWDTWDNLEPYGSGGPGELPNIELGGTVAEPTITISPEVGVSAFVAGEWVVIPVNIRNGGDGSLTLSATVTSYGNAGENLALDCCWEVNPALDGVKNYEFMVDGTNDANWAPLSSWSQTIAGHSGQSGSAIGGATVLFVKISAPGDAIPSTYNLTVALNRS